MKKPNKIIRNNRIELSRNHQGWSIKIKSRGDESPPALILAGFGYFLWVRIPGIIPPYREKVVANTWDAATVARMGRNWYWDIDEREYGLSLWEGHLSVCYGRQSGDSSTEQRWGYFLPWTQWRFVRHSFYDLNGDHIWTQDQKNRSWDVMDAARKSAPKARFKFLDFDGEEIEVTTLIEEREWLRGEKWCSWLSWFYKPQVRRSLDLEFSKETGRRKGSWKGGTLGHGIEMLDGELHESAFRRYCAENEMTFVGSV